MVEFVGLKKAIKAKRLMFYLGISLGLLLSYILIIAFIAPSYTLSLEAVLFLVAAILLVNISYSGLFWAEEIERLDWNSFRRLDSSMKRHNDNFVKISSIFLFPVLIVGITIILLLRGTAGLIVGFVFTFIATVIISENYMKKAFKDKQS